MSPSPVPNIVSARFAGRDITFKRDPHITTLAARVAGSVSNRMPPHEQAKRRAALARARADEARRYALFLDQQAAAFELFATDTDTPAL